MKRINILIIEVIYSSAVVLTRKLCEGVIVNCPTIHLFCWFPLLFHIGCPRLEVPDELCSFT